MKKLILFAAAAMIAAFATTSCQQDPDLDELSDNLLVYTNYDSSFDFAAATKVLVVDSILVINATGTEQYWKDANSAQIVKKYKDLLYARGYDTTAVTLANADLGVQISYVESIQYFVDYPDPIWWWGYPYYWDPTYWGGWPGWYYPYPIVYTQSIGSLLTDMVDLTADETEDLPVVWSSYLAGLLSGSASVDMTRTLDAITQSFTQSPYLQAGPQ